MNDEIRPMTPHEIDVCAAFLGLVLAPEQAHKLHEALRDEPLPASDASAFALLGSFLVLATIKAWKHYDTTARARILVADQLDASADTLHSLARKVRGSKPPIVGQNCPDHPGAVIGSTLPGTPVCAVPGCEYGVRGEA